MKRTSVSVIACLLVCCLCSGASSARTAATVGSKLRVELDAADADDVIPVIITLSDKVKLHQFKHPNRSVRRSNLITALKSKAAQSQRGLEAFLRARGASEIKRLWLINALAVRLSAKDIHVVENRPDVESIRLDYTVSAPVMGAAEPTLSIDDVTVDEAAGNAVFTVMRAGDTSLTVTVDYTSADVSAVAGADYTAVSGPLTFLAGETSHTITVPILEDAFIEVDETFNVTLNNAVGATLTDDTGIATITDNDTPSLSIDDVTVDEAGGNAVFTVTRANDTGPIILVNYAGVDGSATAGTDYLLDPNQLTFLSGVTSKTVTVQILEDILDEGDETFTVTLSSAINATLADDTGIGTITDNDMPILSIDDVGVVETAGSAVFTVTRAGDTGQPVSVQYDSTDVSALAAADYSPVSGLLNFAVGEISQTITVPILVDALVEADETFNVTLNNAVGATLADATGMGTIFGNQPPGGGTFWNLNDIRAPDLWTMGYIGQGIVVANMDSGVDGGHPDLAPRWRGGSNSWYDVHGQHPVTPIDVAGPVTTGHGTKSMALMAAGAATGAAIGVAPGVRWIAVKVWDDAGTATISHFTLGFQWLLDPDGEPSTDDAPHVINNSWGFEQPQQVGTCDTVFQADIQVLQAAGIAVVFSAGNSGTLGPGSDVSPANNPEGYAVGAVDSTLSVSNFSSRGPSACDGTFFPELVAPGEQVWTTDVSIGGTPPLVQATGTSFASPHVAGAMAVLLSAFPDTSVADLESALIQSAQDLGNPGADHDYGYGLVDVLGAYNWLATDSDGDGVRDVNDNCIAAPNGPLIPDAGGNSQLDTDEDGFGNVCDADISQPNDGITNALDVGTLKAQFLTSGPDADFNGDGIVNALDVGILKQYFLQPPGPSCCGSF